MTVSDIARQNAVECIKVGYRQGKDGHILLLAMNPHDVPASVATAPLGTRWMVALVQIGDDEQPQGQATSGSAPPSPADAADSPAAAPKPKRDWDAIPPSQQAGIACADRRFAKWLAHRMDYPTIREGDADEAAERLRRELCLSSRSDLDKDPEAAKRWRDLYSMFQTDTRYGGLMG